MTIPASAYITLHCDDPPTDLYVLLDAERPEISAGYGGWNEVPRPGRTTVTTWKGQPARRMAVSILFDSHASGKSLETDISRLERMGLPRPGGAPPLIKLKASGGVIPWATRNWVIDAIDWGDALMNSSGNRVRQAAKITFLEFVADDLVKFQSAAIARRAKAAVKPKAKKKKKRR